jgi:hypothetical protein
MKTFEYDGRTFTVKNTSLALENLWLQFAFTKEGQYNKECVVDFSRDGDAVNKFMRYMCAGDHEGIDWYEDAPKELFAGVFADFFTNWSEKMIEALATLSTSSPEKPLPRSRKAAGAATATT